MTIQEIKKKLSSYDPMTNVIVMTVNNERISTNFTLYNCPIHSNMFSVYGIINSKDVIYLSYSDLNCNMILKQISKFNNISTRGYKGQEIDYVEPEDREILFTNNIKSIYCGKYKYLMIVDICKSNKDEIIIYCNEG